MMCRVGVNYSLPLEAQQLVTQGGLLSSLIFKVCINCVVREWLQQVLGEDVPQDGVEEAVCDQCVEFFVDNG